jgi:hypothetical protein
VVAVVLAGSRGAATGDLESDFDIYVYTLRQVPVEFRRGLMGESAEIDYRSPEWIEGQLDRVLVRQEATLGYTTCFWYNVNHSEALFDPRGWYQQSLSLTRSWVRRLIQSGLPIR